ncbi:MADS-box transcription factor 6-like [Morus notabilis]|uniref:MADS-box transcription factor 6-like n=1 Tax=Morus notabilis TaxID=981085 RepID=UPI000CED2504|nr:MADS-box transcription factor 6-like [Morus notabilis]
MQKHHIECNGPWRSAGELLKVMSNLKVEQLTTQELIHLERDLHVILGQTRERKTQLMMETITTLAEKEKQLIEEKSLLENQIGTMMGSQSHHRGKELQLIQWFA